MNRSEPGLLHENGSHEKSSSEQNFINVIDKIEENFALKSTSTMNSNDSNDLVEDQFEDECEQRKQDAEEEIEEEEENILNELSDIISLPSITFSNDEYFKWIKNQSTSLMNNTDFQCDQNLSMPLSRSDTFMTQNTSSSQRTDMVETPKVYKMNESISSVNRKPEFIKVRYPITESIRDYDNFTTDNMQNEIQSVIDEEDEDIKNLTLEENTYDDERMFERNLNYRSNYICSHDSDSKPIKNSNQLKNCIDDRRKKS